MEVPPKSDEESSKPDDASSESSRTTKRPARSRLFRSKKAPKSAAKEPASNEPELTLAPVPAEPPPPPPAPPPAAVPPPVSGPEPESAQREASPPPAGGGSSGGDGPGYDDGGNGGGHYQQHGGGKFGRRHRGKNFRGGGGGKWVNPNFQGNKHPPQPPPPKEAVHYGDLPDPARFQNLEAVDQLARDIADSKEDPVWLNELYALNLGDLTAFARKLGAKFEGAPNRRQLITQVFQACTEQKRPIYDEGYLDLTDRGHGFVVHADVNYRLYPEDAFLPEIFVRQLGLKRGHLVEVQVQPPQGNDRCPAVVAVRQVMGGKPAEISKVKPFEELTPYYPLKRILLEMPGQKDVSMRMVDIITPVGFGQRGLIVAPPRTGKTILMQNMANSIAANSPEARLIILLVDERPEEVTDFKRHCKGEVVSSTFDETPESHVHCAEMVIEKARRLVEQGEHVVILLDSITRLARAYNALASNSGKIMSGGLEATALQKPKRFFGSARNIEGAGSLTILGTALVDTGSRMDEIIFEEFKGTGNMELHLDRDLVNKRIFPAINIDKSGTRKEELIYHPDELARVYSLRRAMQGVPAADSMDMLIQRLKKTKTNAEFLLSLNR
ncbi:MAG: transcription termination factor Rho [Opitutaceae bacterium]|nr:transcription termination factor Rho [Opitutaceae bacterium]